MIMDFSIILENLDIYFSGALTTIILVAESLLLGLIFAVPVAFMRNSSLKILRLITWFYIYIFRGTPLLVQLFIIYYGLGQLESVKESFAWQFLKEPYWCALLAFTLNTTAYTAEIIRGAINLTPTGEIEAATALGMGRLMLIRRILLPSVFRRILPAYSNEVIFMLHGSAIAGIITLVDITGAAQIINSRYYNPFEAYFTAAIFYMLLTFILVFFFRKMERRWLVHLKPQS
ncbi:MAG: ABC transporter permease [Marinomonadaceae bacterium]